MIERSNIAAVIFSRKATLTLSIAILILFTSQPFGDITRGAIYAIAAIHALITFFFSLKTNGKLNVSIGSVSLISFYLLTTILFIIHNDIMSLGLSHLHLFFIILNCFITDSTNRIENELIYISKLFVGFGLYKILGSFTAFAIMKFIPSVTDFMPGFIATVIKNSYTNPQRPNGLTLNPNTLGAVTALSCWCSFYLFYRLDDRKWKTVSIITIISGIFLSLRVASRTSLLIMACFGFVFILLSLLSWRYNSKNVNKNSMLIISVVFLLLLILIGLFVFSEPVRTYFLDVVLRFNSLKTASNRTVLQKAALEATRNNRLWGISYVELSRNVLSGIGHTHNVFIQVIVSAGIPAFLLFVIFVAYSLYCSLKIIMVCKKTNKLNKITGWFIFSAEVAVLIQSMFEQFLIASYVPASIFAYIIFSSSILLYGNLKNVEFESGIESIED